MFSRAISLALVALFALFALAAATPMPGDVTVTKTVTDTVTVTATGPATTVTAKSVSQCNTGNLQCCQHTADASDPVTGLLLGLLGIVVEAVDGLIGISCSPISIVGLGSGSACNASPVCCENNTFTGLIVIGCVPINIIL